MTSEEQENLIGIQLDIMDLEFKMRLEKDESKLEEMKLQIETMRKRYEELKIVDDQNMEKFKVALGKVKECLGEEMGDLLDEEDPEQTCKYLGMFMYGYAQSREDDESKAMTLCEHITQVINIAKDIA